jgi:hypothetical protein
MEFVPEVRRARSVKTILLAPRVTTKIQVWLSL